jgi:hypothetical protein
MNQDADQLREAFVAHEYLAPDAADVIAVVHEKARRYRRRRRAAQSAGGAVLGAGLVAGTVAAPGWLNATSSRHSGSSLSLAAPAPQPIPTPLASSSRLASPLPLASTAPVASPSPLTSAQQDQAISAYFAAGYDYNDALALAQLWHMSGDPSTIKAEAGRRLLAGQTLPFKPSAAGVATAAEDADLNAFFGAGYTYEDAVGLAQLWKTSDPYQAKIDAGGKLLAGVALPIAPGSQPTPSASPTTPDESVSATDLDAYFAAGYGYDEALQLAQLWHMTGDPATIKAEAGRRLLAGQTLPITPSAPSPTPTGSVPVNGPDAAVAAYFGAGYTYDDALTLGKMWNIADTYQVKADAGQKLLAGQTLPIKP